jgi:hypothetical protein
MKRRLRNSLLGVAAIATLGGCYDLAVDNSAGVDREQVLSSPRDIEVFIAGAFVNLWSAMTNGYPWLTLSSMAEQVESSNDANGMYDLGKVPRERFPNTASYSRFSFVKTPWAIFYETIANADDMLAAIRDRNIKIVDIATGRDNTSRAVAFARTLQGTSHMYLALLFDSAAVMGEDVDLREIPVLPFKPYREVFDSSLRMLNDALEIMDTAQFTLPRTDQLWIYGVQSSSSDLTQFIHSQIARGMVYLARTPEERAAVDWQAVLDHINKGIVTDFGPRGRPNTLLNFLYWQVTTTHPVGTYAGNQTTNSARARVDLRIVGPADTSAAYRTWLARIAQAGGDSVHPPGILTPDRRIEPPTSTPDSTKAGSHLFRYHPTDPPASMMPTERGKKYYSNYWFNALAPLGNHLDQLSVRQHVVLSVAEMNFLRAEAFLRLGRIQEAVDIINATRTAQIGGSPNLPPVTASGTVTATSTPAEIAACVPKRTDGTCGDLWDALIYEKRLLTYGYDGLTAFADMRGWGCLEPGTMLHLPVPGDQLLLMGRPNYSFGGAPGQPGNAGPPDPARCRMFYLFP